MSTESLKLTIYFGERDRADGGFIADALCDLYERYGLKTSVMLRGIEGFGARHALQTQRLLTLSEDLPLVSIAVDTRERIDAAMPEVRSLVKHGLVSLERARMTAGELETHDHPYAGEELLKLTVYGVPVERSRKRAASIGVVELLRRRGAAGASVILGVDGTLHGERQRARFFSRNAHVPLTLLAIGPWSALQPALGDLVERFVDPVFTFERARVCKSEGQALADPFHLPERDDRGLPIWQKVMVHSEEQAQHEGKPLYFQLVRRLREAEAAGVTVLRGVWGFYGDRAPFGDRFFAVRRSVPVHAVIVDTPANVARWWPVLDEVTSESGMVTSELVPASRPLAVDPGEDALRLASATPPRRD